METQVTIDDLRAKELEMWEKGEIKETPEVKNSYFVENENG